MGRLRNREREKDKEWEIGKLIVWAHETAVSQKSWATTTIRNGNDNKCVVAAWSYN